MAQTGVPVHPTLPDNVTGSSGDVSATGAAGGIPVPGLATTVPDHPDRKDYDDAYPGGATKGSTSDGAAI